MLGRAQPGQAEVKFETGRQLTSRFENLQQAKKEFWGRWIEEIFPELLKQSKWTRDKKDVKVGDIVLKKDETAAGQTYKYARVIKVHVGTDGRVRSADIEYKLPGETVYRTTTRPIHKLVMVVPVEEQAAAAGPKEPELLPLEKPKAGEADELPQARDTPGDNPQRKEKAGKKSTQKVKCKKVNSRRKAGKQTRTIVVAVPKEEEEITDTGAARRRRGRPRKALGTEPPDPRKGSVLDPEKGVCADPVEGDATLGVGGPGPPLGVSEHQLSLDRGGEKT
jgi:hypothetical protein